MNTVTVIHKTPGCTYLAVYVAVVDSSFEKDLNREGKRALTTTGRYKINTLEWQKWAHHDTAKTECAFRNKHTRGGLKG